MTLADNKAPRAAQVEARTQKSPDPGSPRLERIREILFGDRSRAIEERFDALRSQMVLHLAKLEREIEERSARLDEAWVKLDGVSSQRNRALLGKLDEETEARTVALGAQTHATQRLRDRLEEQAAEIERVAKELTESSTRAEERAAHWAADVKRQLAEEASRRNHAEAALRLTIEQSTADQQLAVERLAVEGCAADDAIREEAKRLEHAVDQRFDEESSVRAASVDAIESSIAACIDRVQRLERTLADRDEHWQAQVRRLEVSLRDHTDQLEKNLKGVVERMERALETRLDALSESKADRTAVARTLRDLAQSLDSSTPKRIDE